MSGMRPSFDGLDNPKGDGFRTRFRRGVTSPVASRFFIAVVDKVWEVTLEGVTGFEGPSAFRVALTLGGVNRGLLAAARKIAFDAEVGVIGAGAGAASVTAGGVGGRRGAHAADFLATALGGVGGRS